MERWFETLHPSKIQTRHAYVKPKAEIGILPEVTLAERVKQLVIFAKNPDEVDVIAEAYRKLTLCTEKGEK